MKFKDYFDDDGNFRVSSYDPYRASIEYEHYHSKFFDGGGDLNPDVEAVLQGWIKQYKLGPFCDAVKLYYAEQFSCNTKGNYSTIYMWR